MIKVDVGCGPNCMEGFVGLDCIKFNDKVEYVVNLDKESLPFREDSVDYFLANHVIEHLNNPLSFLEECYYALKVGGVLEVAVPYWSSPNSVGAMHKTMWNFSSMSVFDDSNFEVKDMHWKVLEPILPCFPPLRKLLQRR